MLVVTIIRPALSNTAWKMKRGTGVLRSLGFSEHAPQPGQSSTPDAWSLANIRRTSPAAESLITNDLATPSNPLITKLRNLVALAPGEAEVLEILCRNPRTYVAEQNLIREATAPSFVCIIISGLAYRYKLLQDGHRQILGFLIPGDVCDLSFTFFDRADYSVATLVESRIVKLPISQLRESLASSCNLRRAFELAAHLDNVILRQWLVNIGQRKAHEKLSYFLYEMTQRLSIIGADSQDGWIDFPLSQAILADAIGSTPVHINRTLQRMRREGTIALSHRQLKILDPERLTTAANCEGNYLDSVNHRSEACARENAGDSPEAQNGWVATRS